MNITDFEKIYQCFNRSSNGIAGVKDGEWYILAGSRVAEDDTPSYRKTGRTAKLIKNGIVENNRFTKDYKVKSRCVAVSILGRHGMSAGEAENKSREVTAEEALQILQQATVVTPCVSDTPASKEEPPAAVSEYELEHVITDATFQKLLFCQNRANIFSIVGQTHTEHWHSSFLCWLFDPSSSLQLGGFALERLLSLYEQKQDEKRITYDDIDNMDYDSFEFQTEKALKNVRMQGWKDGSIDVYGSNDDYVIVIENKVTAAEQVRDGIGQTEMYYDEIERKKEPGQKAIYIFITPDPNQNSKCSHFVQITYQEIYDSVIRPCLDNPNISDESRYVLEQYASNLRVPYQNSAKAKAPMALIHMAECEQIYQKYPAVLDHIYETAKSGNVESVFYRRYKKYQQVFDEIFMSVEAYAETPDASVQRKVITFDSLVGQKKLAEGSELYMDYDGERLFAKVVKDPEDGKCYLALLDGQRHFYLDENGKPDARYMKYRTASAPASDAVYVNRIRRGEKKDRVPLNGTLYWKLAEGDIPLKEIMNERNLH